MSGLWEASANETNLATGLLGHARSLVFKLLLCTQKRMFFACTFKASEGDGWES
jgi:hypothetical protein